MGEAREIDMALLFADLSGYTALTETHGGLRASEIVLRFVSIVEASLEPGVTIVSSIGDDVFVIGAETLAVARTAFRLRDAVEREPRFPRIRMGIHRGPIIEREGRLFGAPINLTARLCDHAEGGHILCTQPIAEAISALAEIEPRSLGEMHFKNVSRSVEVFELRRMTEKRASAEVDPVCRMQVAAGRAAAAVEHAGVTYLFCSVECARDFANAPELYVNTR